MRGHSTKSSSPSSEEASAQAEAAAADSASRCAGQIQDAPGSGGADGEFHVRVFNMLLRYETLFILDQGTQGALPQRVFNLLNERFDIAHECFASPLNVSYSSVTFNSLFVDCDQYFGGQGSFFRAIPHGGCFEANPPFDRQSVHATYQQINDVLNINSKRAEKIRTAGSQAASADEDALLYVVVAPRSVSEGGTYPEVEKRWVLRTLTLWPHHHVFTRGFQHRNDMEWVSPNRTYVSFLGNESAARRWASQLTEEGDESLRRAFAQHGSEDKAVLFLGGGGGGGREGGPSSSQQIPQKASYAAQHHQVRMMSQTRKTRAHKQINIYRCQAI